MNILEEIYKYKLDFVSKAKSIVPLNELIEQSKNIEKKDFQFSKKLKNNKGINIIGELKKASPSAGDIINDGVDLMNIAKIYDDAGVSCFSILTDEKYFNGSLQDLIELRKNTETPILRKEFIVDEYQVYESFISGADCILIILSMIDLELAKKIENVAISLGLDSIIEVHDEKEINEAVKFNSNLIGINNRDLKSFSVDINNAVNLANSIKTNKILISESGINSKSDIDQTVNKSKIRTFLIGESLMRSKDIRNKFNSLIN